jgi:hypothetical protein
VIRGTRMPKSIAYTYTMGIIVPFHANLERSNYSERDSYVRVDLLFTLKCMDFTKFLVVRTHVPSASNR